MEALNYKLVILTGASGAGKTSLVETLKMRIYKTPVSYLHFDSVGVPSLEEMVRVFGSGENWQRAMTEQWIQKIANEYLPRTNVLFEGQARIAFIVDALKKSPLADVQIVLVDCDDSERRVRLVENRNQPELANDTMMSWAAFLRQEAAHTSTKIIDTTSQPLSESAAEIERLLGINRVDTCSV